MLPQLLVLTLALAPSLVSAAIFPSDSLVKMLDAKGFKEAMKENRTSMVAFVAPWCGHCQKMAPEYSRSALGLFPLVPVYAVDCDAQSNKRLCADQGVTGFPTIKLFPRGNTMPPVLFEGGQRTASSFFYFVTKRIPNKGKPLHIYEDILNWVAMKVDRPRLLLLTKEKKVPLLWQVLDNRYQGHFEFGNHLDKKGKTSEKMGFEAGAKKDAKVLLYPAGSKKPIRYEGINKYEPLIKFLDSILDGTVDLKVANEQAKSEEFIPTPEDIELEEKQEAERIYFEKAIKDARARGKTFHGTGMKDMEKIMKKHGIFTQKSEPESGATNLKDEPVKASTEQIVFEVPVTSSETSHPATETEREPQKDEL